MIEPDRIFTCRYCGDRVRPKGPGLPPSRCGKQKCRRRYERERKRRYRTIQRAKVAA